jgi:hypothetical protein
MMVIFLPTNGCFQRFCGLHEEYYSIWKIGGGRIEFIVLNTKFMVGKINLS